MTSRGRTQRLSLAAALAATLAGIATLAQGADLPTDDAARPYGRVGSFAGAKLLRRKPLAAQATGLPEYRRVSGISGNLSSVGSDTLANLMSLWSEAFQRHYPNVNIQVQAAGSSTAPPALTQGTSSLGPMSRLMKDEELAAFERRFGYAPTPIRVAIDALALYVHRDNPIHSLHLTSIDAVFSATRRCGAARDVTTWGALGLGGPWADRPIQLYGRNSVSGTYGYFKKTALCSGDFKNSVNELPGSASVVQAVGGSLGGIGYSGTGYRTPGVRAVPVRQESGETALDAMRDNVRSRSYPLARDLYVYVNKRPDTPLPPLEREFLRLVLSGTGQAAVGKLGYIALSARLAARELRKIE